MIHMSDVPDIASPNEELSWLIPIMTPILQHQGTNIRALLYHMMQCRESPTLDPRFNTQNVNQIITSVIENQWLELMSDEDIKCLVEEKKEARELLISKTKEELNRVLWNYAGSFIQTGLENT